MPTETPLATLTIAWVEGGDLYGWSEAAAGGGKIAATGVIQPFLAPDGKHVAFIRGQQGDKSSLWAVGIDGVGEQQLVKPEALKSMRDGHPQIDQVKWLDAQTVYFTTIQHYDSGDVRDNDLYRAQLGSSDPQLILPPGAGGDFALSPDGKEIAVIRAGIYDTQKGEVALLDPLGVKVVNKLSFTALHAPSELPFYPPLEWSSDSSFVRVPIPNRDNDRVALWRIPVEGDATIFGYISAAPDGLPVWFGDQVIYTRPSAQAGVTDLLLADADGEHEQVYDSGKITHLRWVPDGSHFIYDKDGMTHLGKRGDSPWGIVDEHAQFFARGIELSALGPVFSYSYMTGNAPIITITPSIPADAPLDAVVAP